MRQRVATASDYLQKYSGKEKLLRTVRDVAEGEYRIPGDVIRRVFAGLRTGAPQPTHALKRLTARERGILKKCVNSQAVYPLSEQHGLKARERRYTAHEEGKHWE